MDPISAFSLACNMAQVVDFGMTVVSGYRETYKFESLARNDHVEEVATTLASVSKGLEKRLAVLPGHATAEDRELQNLAVKANDAATELLSKFTSIKLNTRSKREALFKYVKAVRKKDDIDALQRQLESYQKLLETSMLKRLAQKFDLATLQYAKVFTTLDRSLQGMIESLAAGHTQIRDIIFREGEATRTHITDSFAQLSIAQVDRQHRRAVLASLFFEDIYVRQELIKEAHKNTFQWIFGNPGPLQPWNDFAAWLKQGQGTYWISGKAGSGKSTMTNYVYAEQRTPRCVEDLGRKRKRTHTNILFLERRDSLVEEHN